MDESLENMKNAYEQVCLEKEELIKLLKDLYENYELGFDVDSKLLKALA